MIWKRWKLSNKELIESLETLLEKASSIETKLMGLETNFRLKEDKQAPINKALSVK